MAKIETNLVNSLNAKGYKALKNGWPDLLVTDSKHNPFFIEAKDQGDRLRGHQREMLQTLTDLGLSVFIVSKDSQLQQNGKNKLHLYDIEDIKDTETLSEALSRIEKEIIIKTLAKYHDNIQETCNRLGINARQLRYAKSKI